MVSPGLIEDQEDEELKQHQPSPDVSISPDNFDNRIVKVFWKGFFFFQFF